MYEVTFAGMTATTWTWFVLGMLGVLIVALVWYYAAQNSKRLSNSNADVNKNNIDE